MKSLFLALALAMGNLLFAQDSNSVLELQNSIENLPCDTDQLERTISLDQIENDQKNSIGIFHTIGCKFSLEQTLEAGNYVLTVSTLGYEEAKINFEVAEDSEKITLNPITLKEKLNTLSEVTVYGNKRQYIKVDSDKTTISVKDNGMLNSGSSLDAVKRLPGVITSPTGGLSLNGKNVRIYIDGAPSSLTGTDLQNYLLSLPASAIEKVELIYNPGASFDANSSGSVINIITTSKKMKGVNASFNINYNFNKYQKPSPQILLNGKEKNLSWQTMMGFNYIETENRNIVNQEFTSFNPMERLRQENLNVMTFRNQYFRGGLNYKINTKSNLLFNYANNFSNDRTKNDASTVGTGIDFENMGESKAKSSLHELSLQYKTKLDTLGRTLDVTAYGNFFDRNPRFNSTSIENGGVPTFNQSDIDFSLKNYYLKYDFSFPFEKMNFSINTGGKYNTTEVTDLGKYRIESAPQSVIDFDYSEHNLAFYAEARKKYKKFNFTAGIRFEDFKVEREASTVADKIQYNNTNFFPNASVMYEMSNDINFTASYSKKIEQPGYFTIDPNANSSFNKYNTSGGDATLNPIFYDNYELKMSAFQFMQLGVNYNEIKDANQFAFTAKPGELVSQETFIPQDITKRISAYLSIPIPLDYFFKGKEEFQKRMNTIEKMNYIMFNVNYTKTTYDNLDLGFSVKGNTSFSLQSQIILPWEITNTMSYFMLPKGNWEIYKITKPIQGFDISFNRDFLDKKLKLGLHCFDVFDANETNALIKTTNLNTQFYQKQDSRTFRISLTYNFGNLKLEKENTNINTDKVNQGGGGLK